MRKRREREGRYGRGVGDRDIQGRSQFSRQCTRQPARRVCTLHGVFRELHRRARRGAARGGTRDNEKCTRHDILLARPSYNCRAGSISLLLSPSLPHVVYLPFSSSHSLLLFLPSPSLWSLTYASSSGSSDARRKQRAGCSIILCVV